MAQMKSHMDECLYRAGAGHRAGGAWISTCVALAQRRALAQKGPPYPHAPCLITVIPAKAGGAFLDRRMAGHPATFTH